MSILIICFKVYDICGEFNSQLNEEVVYCIGFVFVEELSVKMVVVGGDVCLILYLFKLVLSVGLIDGGVIVIDIGMVGIEEIYFVIKYFGVDGGIEVMVSYNLINYNGMKLVKVGLVFISGDIGLNVIKECVEQLDDVYVVDCFEFYVKSVKIDVDVFYVGKVYIVMDILVEFGQYY